MPAVVNLIAAISTDYVARLAALSPPIPLAASKILIGWPNTLQHMAPPRVVFIPKASKFEGGGPPAMGGTDNVSNFSPGPPAGERLRQQRARTLRTEVAMFEVHVWGVQNQATGSTYDVTQPELDFDATQVLYQTLIQSVHLLASGTYGLGDGVWTSAKLSTTQEDLLGQEFVFSLAFRTPVTDVQLPLVNPGTTASPSTQIIGAQGGAPTQGC